MNCSDFVPGQYYKRIYGLTKRAIVFRVIEVPNEYNMKVVIVHSPHIQFLTPYDVRNGTIRWYTRPISEGELVWELL